MTPAERLKEIEKDFDDKETLSSKFCQFLEDEELTVKDFIDVGTE